MVTEQADGLVAVTLLDGFDEIEAGGALSDRWGGGQKPCGNKHKSQLFHNLMPRNAR